MSETFSESWHRIASQRVELRPTLHIHRQFFRNERWYVISDPLSNQFFRVRAAAYEFIARLGDGRTVEECWHECLKQFPDSAPGQEEVIQLLARLYQGNLIRSDLPPDSRKLFDRFKKRKDKELRSKLMSILFIRIPLLDPDSFLKRSLPYLRWAFSPIGAVLWLLVIGLAIKTGVDHSAALMNQGQSVLAPSNLGLLYIGMAFIKLLHEFGHGYMCRRFGGEVHTMGVMLLILSPLPFVDATSSWGFRSRWQRMLVAAAGMIVELLVAAVAMFIWAMTGEGLVHSLAYNIIFVASVSTVLFNANPLLRFDGYYILSDLIDIPNLHQRSRRMWVHICERYLFGQRKSLTPASTRREGWILTIFGALSGVYRIFVFGGILLFIADQYLLLGLVMGIVGVFTWIVVPSGKLVQYLMSSPRIERVRRRAVAVTCLGVAGIIALLAIVPFPHSFSAPGVLQSEGYAGVFSQAPGAISEIVKHSGATVNEGDVLLILQNPELGFQVTQTEA
ncbi:MAG: peptidase M50, partial [Verrucomicrobiae bacterium]|nr:peptidase M50 [Verrucomicrobiae bacterium]